MSIRAVTPYLIVHGRAEQAIAVYCRVFDARLEGLQRFGDIDGGCPAARRDQVMHAALRVGGALLMLSDGPEERSPDENTSSVSVALDFDDAADLRRRFTALSDAGSTIVPLFQAAWGLFGVVRDEFGVHWMFSCSEQPMN